ncbi:hypothetical protein Dimus_006463 [Dionaea muscipula]
MGGKGRKRREKNYRSAHGGDTRLPPPPDRSAVDALPSKLRRIIAFTTASSPASPNTIQSSAKARLNPQRKSKKTDHDLEKRVGLKAGLDGDHNECSNGENGGDNNLQKSGVEKRKKRKREQVKDLRFGSGLEKFGVVSTRRQRKKEFLKAKKKKQKKPNVENNLDFHKHEEVKFGEVVQAPPKLAVPKAFKMPLDASHERVRLKTVEAYRNLRNWTSRPGVHLPPATAPSTM